MLGVGLVARKAGGPRTLAQLQTAAVWVFSLRKVVSTYSGSCIKVRRSSDNATQDIDFDGTGWLDTAAIATFCGAGNGFIDTWYDQSPSAAHASNATTTSQPAIYVSGAQIVLANGKPAVRWIAGNTISLTNGSGAGTGIPYTADCSAFAVVEKLSTQTAQSQIIGGTSGCMGLRFTSSTGVVAMLRTGQLNLETAPNPGVGMHAISATFDAAKGTLYVDGVATVGSTPPALTQNVSKIGGRWLGATNGDGFGNQGSNPRYSELLYWNTGLTAAEHAVLRADAVTTYGTA